MKTKGEINRLGDKIREEKDNISNSTIDILQNYRISHKDTLSQVFNELCGINKKSGKNYIVTYRIKRFQSIIGKLHRYPDMQFSRMWDIGGCRCIVKSDDDVYRLKKLIEENPILEIKKENDYIKKPQSEGYKSLHLYLCIKDNPIVIELQIRNQNDHNWATLVEITDLIFDAKLKEFSENKDLLRFHLLLSKTTELNNVERKEIADIVNKYNYIDTLSDVFARNYIDVRNQWLKIESLNNNCYFLIETEKNEIPKITSYKSFEEAEDVYLNIYKNSKNANVVLTHLPKPNYKDISIAYSNYILTFHSFFEDCYSIFQTLIEYSLINREYINYYKYFKLYNSILFNHLKNLIDEFNEVEKISKRNDKDKKAKRLRGKEKEWRNDLNWQIQKYKTTQKRFLTALKSNIPPNKFGQVIVNYVSKMVINKFEKRIRRIMNQTA